LTVTLFERANLQPPEVFPQGVANQRGTVQLRASRGPVRRPQQPRIENNLDCLHIWTLIHSILHIQVSAFHSHGV